MDEINIFINRIPEFNKKTAGELIPYFAFYKLNIKHEKNVTPSTINQCFSDLEIMPYSNISAYLNSKSKGKEAIFLKQKDGYILNRNTKEFIAKQLNETIQIPVSDELLSLDIFADTRHYHKAVAKQMLQCFDLGLYDASLVMMRKLFETLIIECFERHEIENEIKDSNGVFLYLSDLIPKFVNSTKWNVSRNFESSIKKVKKYGDLSAHNRRFIAKKSDFNDLKFEIRQAVQEIILLIDYSNW